MKLIAKDIATVVGHALHVVVATHRHADHISGFATNEAKNGTGDIIARLEPQLVDPAVDGAARRAEGLHRHGQTMKARQRRAQAVADADERGGRRGGARGAPPAAPPRSSEIQFIAADGVANLSAVKNLAGDGQEDARPRTCNTARRSRRSRRCCPASRSRSWARRRSSRRRTSSSRIPVNKQEVLALRAVLGASRRGRERHAGRARSCFPDARVLPQASRRSRSRIAGSCAASAPCVPEQLLGLVRSMDDALNNTSVILLFEAGGKKLLFPGDAQWENWELALKKNAALLKDVDVYKVGHHGSLNATPKTLWNAFSRNGRRRKTAGSSRDRHVDAQRQQTRARREQYRGATSDAGDGVEAQQHASIDAGAGGRRRPGAHARIRSVMAACQSFRYSMLWRR